MRSFLAGVNQSTIETMTNQPYQAVSGEFLFPMEPATTTPKAAKEEEQVRRMCKRYAHNLALMVAGARLAVALARGALNSFTGDSSSTFEAFFRAVIGLPLGHNERVALMILAGVRAPADWTVPKEWKPSEEEVASAWPAATSRALDRMERVFAVLLKDQDIEVQKLLKTLAHSVPEGEVVRTFTYEEIIDHARKRKLMPELLGGEGGQPVNNARLQLGRRFEKWRHRPLVDPRGRRFECWASRDAKVRSIKIRFPES